MSKPPSEFDYRGIHMSDDRAQRYNDEIYSDGSGDSAIWSIEQAYLDEVIDRRLGQQDRYLDFACGTGRVIASLAPRFRYAQGLDISAAMLAIARQKALNAEFTEGDITEDPTIIGDAYDLITAFRFFLNAQPSLRDDVIRTLATKLDADGILIFNIHNSRPSLLWLQNRITDVVIGRAKASMSRREVAEMLDRSGLTLIESHVTGILPKCVCRILKPKLWCKLDSVLTQLSILRRFGSHIIYVCRRSPVSRAASPAPAATDAGRG